MVTYVLRRFVVGAAIAALFGGMTALGTIPAQAAAVPTLTGPAYVTKNSTVTMHGVAQPGESVHIWFHRKGDPATYYTDRRLLTADSAGAFSTTYVADTDYSYYATTVDGSSPVVLTKLYVTTISGPQSAAYGATVRLSGVALPPGSHVTVYFHRQNSTGYTAGRSLTSDAYGNYSTTYVASADYLYYAVAHVASSIGKTALVRASCASTGPIMRSLPFSSIPVGAISPFATLQVTDGHGRYAGYASDGKGDFAVYSWRSGYPLSVAGRFAYSGWSVDTVHVDAVTSAGGVIVDVARGSSDVGNRVAYALTGGHRYRLAYSGNWTSVKPIGMTAGGAIVGVVRVGVYGSSSARYYIVSWAGARSPYQVLVRNGSLDPSAAVAANGDIAFSQDSTATYLVRLASGALIHLGGVAGHQTSGFYIQRGAGTAFYGILYTDGSGSSTIARWDVATVPASGVVPARLLSPLYTLDWSLSAGIRGDVVAFLHHQGTTFPHQPPRYLRTSRGALVKLPATYAYSGPATLDITAVDGTSTIGYTSPADGLPHLFRCH
jgi:hypothetical protein